MSFTNETGCGNDDFWGLLREFYYVDDSNYDMFYTDCPSDDESGKPEYPPVYGNVNNALEAYRVLGPAFCISLMVLITLSFTVLFVQYKRGSPIADSVYTLLVTITIFNFMSIAGSVAEHTYLYQHKSDFGMLPLYACAPLYGLEKISQVCHAVSIWLTAAMCIQKTICIWKPFVANRIVSPRITVSFVGVSIVLGTAPFIVQFVDSSFFPLIVGSPDGGFVTCRRQLKSFIPDPVQYLRIMAWVTVLASRLLPCLVISVTSAMIVLKLKKQSKIAKKLSVSKRGANAKTRVAKLVIFVAMIVLIVEVTTSVVFILYVMTVFDDGVNVIDTQATQRASMGIDIVLYVSYVVILMSYCITPRTVRNFKQRLTELTTGTSVARASVRASSSY